MKVSQYTLAVASLIVAASLLVGLALALIDFWPAEALLMVAYVVTILMPFVVMCRSKLKGLGVVFVMLGVVFVVLNTYVHTFVWHNSTIGVVVREYNILHALAVFWIIVGIVLLKVKLHVQVGNAK